MDIGHRRQFFGAVDDEWMFWSAFPLRIDGRSQGLDKIVGNWGRTSKTREAVPIALPASLSGWKTLLNLEQLHLLAIVIGDLA